MISIQNEKEKFQQDFEQKMIDLKQSEDEKIAKMVQLTDNLNNQMRDMERVQDHRNTQIQQIQETVNNLDSDLEEHKDKAEQNRATIITMLKQQNQKERELQQQITIIKNWPTGQHTEEDRDYVTEWLL